MSSHESLESSSDIRNQMSINKSRTELQTLITICLNTDGFTLPHSLFSTADRSTLSNTPWSKHMHTSIFTADPYALRCRAVHLLWSSWHVDTNNQNPPSARWSSSASCSRACASSDNLSCSSSCFCSSSAISWLWRKDSRISSVWVSRACSS